MTTRLRRPADHVLIDTSDARIERQWAAIEQAGLPQLSARRGVRLRVPALLAGGALAAALLWLGISRLWPGPAPAPAVLPAGALLGSAQQPIAMQLGDGSRVELQPHTRVLLLHNDARRVQLDLRQGVARFHVTHDRTRPFEVEAGPVQVRVVGTRFSLQRSQGSEGEQVRVAVSEGVVEVRRRDQPQAAGQVRSLHAGESWSVTLPPRAPAHAPQPALAEQPDDEDEPAERPEPEGAPQPLAPAHGAQAPASPGHGAAGLFRRASLARRAGRMQEAADGYAELLARYPRDPRAGLCAFELGRIRMDALGDPAGAIEALQRAVAIGAESSFHEDALARIVVADDALGRQEACRSARDRYLERYPRGVHAKALAARCR